LRFVYINLLSISIFFVGCVKVNVKTINSSGVITSDTNYYPFSKKRDIKRWDGITPLHLAVIDKDYDKIKRLLKNGANPFALTTDPVNNYKLKPIDFAYILNDKRSAYILANYMLKHYKNYFNSHKKELINVLAALWRPAPLATLELTQKYGYYNWAKHTLKKLFNTKKYRGTNGKITLTRELALLGYNNALKVVNQECNFCLKEAFNREIKDITENWSYSKNIEEHLNSLTLYKKYVSQNKYLQAEKLIKQYNDTITKNRQQFIQMISNALSGKNIKKDTTTFNGHSLSISYFNYDSSNKHINYKLFYDNHYEGLVVAVKDNNHYSILSSGTTKSINAIYYPQNNRLYTPSCGTQYGVKSIKSAIKYAAKCYYFNKY